MSFKARFSFLGLCLVFCLLVLNLSGLAILVLDLWQALPQGVQGNAAEAAGVFGQSGPPTDGTIPAKLASVILLANLTALPFLLMCIRLRRTVD